MHNPYHGNNHPRYRHMSDGFPNKLSHGLTVQELKQMTQARLQAEAKDKQEIDRLSPLDFEAPNHDIRERTLSRDSTGMGQGILRGTASESTNSIPSLVKISLANSSQANGRQPQSSPIPGGFQSFASLNSSDSNGNFAFPGKQTWESTQHQTRLDALETASTNSYNNSVISDNLGSESVYSNGIGGSMLSNHEAELGSLPYGRSMSYGSSPYVSEVKLDGRSAPSSASASPLSHPNSFSFDAAVGGNRRRTSTLSPNPESIMEDRPHIDGRDLAIPNFTSSGGRASLLERSRGASASSLMGSQQNDTTLQGHGIGLFAYDSIPNRPRTESSVSLPPLSHTADEFGVQGALTSRFVSRGREGPATAFSSGHTKHGHINDGNDFINLDVPVPPGFTRSFGYKSEGPVYENNFAPDALANEMGRLFNVSGSGGNRERLNTYPQSAKSQAPEYISKEFFSDADSFRF